MEFPKEIEFDTFAIGEKIELGVRIKGYRVEAYVDDEWVTLADKKSMGFLWTERFERIKTNKVRIVIYDAAAAPVIRTFGLYKMPDEYYRLIREEKDKMIKVVNQNLQKKLNKYKCNAIIQLHFKHF